MPSILCLLLCTNHYETSHLASLHLTSRKQNRQHVVAVLFPTTRFMKKYWCLLLTYLFVLLKCVLRRKRRLPSQALYSHRAQHHATLRLATVVTSLHFHQAQPAPMHPTAVLFPTTRFVKQYLRRRASSFQLVLNSLFEQRDIYKALQ